MSENWRQSEIILCNVINDKSQDRTAKHLSCDGLLHYKIIVQLAGFFKSVNMWQTSSEVVDRVIRPIRLKLWSSKMQNSPDK